MAYKVIVMPSAYDDLDTYAAHIAQDSKDHARRWLAEAEEVILSLAENPKRFAVIDESEEIGIELRDTLHYSHRIVYQVRDREKTVEVLRVWHSARLLTRKAIP